MAKKLRQYIFIIKILNEMLSKMSNDKDAAKKYFVYSTSKMADEATNLFPVIVLHFCQH